MRERLPAPRSWMPRRVLLTPAALAWAHGRAIAERAAALGCGGGRAQGRPAAGLADGTRGAYREAKSTLAVVAAPPSRRRPQPIPPCADWRFDLAEGCPAHCQYCYLAGSLKGPPMTRVYANLPEILGGLAACLGAGTVTSRSAARAAEGTTFEASCYTDPLGIEHLTGSLAADGPPFRRLGGAAPSSASRPSSTRSSRCWACPPRPHARALLGQRRPARRRGSRAARRRLPARLAAMRRMALAGYPVGLTVAPDHADRRLAGALRGAVRRRGGGARGHAGPRPHGGAHHPPLHAAAPRRCCSAGTRAARSRWTRRAGRARRPGSARPSTSTLRRDARAARLSEEARARRLPGRASFTGPERLAVGG